MTAGEVVAPAPAPLTGVRLYSDGLSKDHKPSFMSHTVALATLFIYTAWLHILLGLAIASMLGVRWALYTLLALVATVFLPAKPVLWPAFNQLWVFKTWREFFNFSYSFEQELDPDKRYIFAEFPHGAYPLSPLIAGTLIQSMFPGWHIYSLAASSVFSIPFWRHFVSWIGSVPASKANFKRLLSHGSVAVIIGGIAEMYMGDPKRERVKLHGRKGFIRVALEEGIDGIVPVYHFGNSQLMDFGPQFLSGISRRWRASFGFLHGWWGLPVPRQVPLYMVTGKAIPVPKVSRDDPAAFEAAADALMETVIEELQAMYDRHKTAYGWAHRPLAIE